MKKIIVSCLKAILMFFVSLALYQHCSAANTYGSATVNEVTSIYDGDTFRVTINWWPDIVGERIPIRIKNIDTPELRGSCEKEILLAREAKQFTVNALRSATKIRIKNMERGSFFRIVADVEVDGVDLGRKLIDAKLAVLYKPGNYDWCTK